MCAQLLPVSVVPHWPCFFSSFKQFLELDPQLRDVVMQFHQSSYTSCLRTLEEMRSSLMLDMYLSQHLHTLLTMIRNKALIQVYIAPNSISVVTYKD